MNATVETESCHSYIPMVPVLLQKAAEERWRVSVVAISGSHKTFSGRIVRPRGKNPKDQDHSIGRFSVEMGLGL